MTQNCLPKPDADVIIVGAGPSGMAAAVELSDAGCSVIVLDMAPAPGGQIYRALEANVTDEDRVSELLAALGRAYRAGMALIRRFRAATPIDYRELTTVWEVRPDGAVGWVRGMEAGYLRGRHVLLANGAMERPTPFPGWTLPGVMTAGAVQTLLKAGRLKPTGRVVLAGTGPLILLLAEQMRRLGVKPALIARTDQATNTVEAMHHLRPGALVPIAKGIGWLIRLRLANIRAVSHISRLEAHGDRSVQAVSYSVGDRRFTVPCDLLVVHDGIVPLIDLAHGAGLVLEWDSANASWRPKTAADGTASTVEPSVGANEECRLRITGDARRIGGVEAAIAHGELAASAILADLNKAAPSVLRRATLAVDRALAVRPFIDTAFPPGLSADPPGDPIIVCRCEELTAGLLRKAIRTGARDINQLRAETRCGMGPCQGRNCMITVARLIAECSAVSAPVPLLVFRARPPVRPLPLGALSNLKGLDPEASKIMTLEDKPEFAIGEADYAEEH
jgi:NADPH-dependent 2,4-dienoyl-CoA reductase/sulfur reductase-like enzyme